MINDLKSEIRSLGDPKRVRVMLRFFKTGKGQYGEGDVFVGLSVPQSRKLALRYKNMFLADIKSLLMSKIHEERLIALFILVCRFKKGKNAEQAEIVRFYVDHTAYINNWDLVDSSADKILGEWLLLQDSVAEIASPALRDRNDILEKLARSESVWERRIAIMATFQFIKAGKPELTLSIAEILLHDKHDLIQKAVGWMLREIGERCSMEAEEGFLKKYFKEMPRTMLRYAIEKFPEEKRKAYLLGKM